MRLDIVIHYRGVSYYYDMLSFGTYSRVYLDNVVLIDIFKWHNHSYSFRAFFYDSKIIISDEYYVSKKELHRAIQKRLQQYLYDV